MPATRGVTTLLTCVIPAKKTAIERCWRLLSDVYPSTARHIEHEERVLVCARVRGRGISYQHEWRARPSGPPGSCILEYGMKKNSENNAGQCTKSPDSRRRLA